MRFALCLLTASLLIGCSWKVGPDYQRPPSAVPAKWRFGTKEVKEVTNVKWWEQLGDHRLNALIERALRGNLDLQLAAARVEQFMGLYGSTRSVLFPQIFGEAAYRRFQVAPQQFGLPADILGSVPDTNLGRLAATMEWEIDVWGKLRRAKEAAKAELLASEAFEQAVILTLVSQVAQTYITLRELDKNREITVEIMKVLGEQLRIAEARFNEGFASQLEVEQVQSELQRRSAILPFVEQAIAETEHAMKVLLGENPGTVIRGLTLDELQLPAVPAGLPSDLLARRPDIRQAEQELIAANARIGVARGLFFPRIFLTGDIGQVSQDLGNIFAPGANFWSVGSNALLPIFTAGRLQGEVQAAEAIQKQTVANYRRAIINAFREFENALIASQKAKERRDHQAQRVASVDHYYRLAQLRYDEGYTDFITVLDSLRQLYEAQIDLLLAQRETFVASIQLYRAMGGGWIVKARADSYNPKPAEAKIIP
ncbi:MAG: efflux transporter outer membrane subunit [Methylotetracoccus sp.]|nr:efflux transporter outer membrane subunit [Methylotetracoccus sp.]